MYKDFIEKEINPDTGFSHFLDKDYYSFTEDYSNIIAYAKKENNIVNELQAETMMLKAYGISNANVYKILCIYKVRLKYVNKKAYDTVLRKWCVYYSYHLDELKRLIKPEWKVKAEQLIDFYVKNKHNPSVNSEYISQPVTLDCCIEDIRALLEKVLLFTKLDLPEETNVKQLTKEEIDIKNKILKCEDTELLNGYYASLLSILNKKAEARKNFSKANNYKAIRVLNTCGLVEAAYKWLDCFPKK